MCEAVLYDKLTNDRVRCRVCSHRCVIASGERGICGVRENVGGTLKNLIYSRLIARDVDPIEKKPLYHFYPGTRAYSIASVGCNFVCQNCQNHYISQYPREHAGRVVGDRVPAEEVVSDAVAHGCHSIAFTYTEPTVAIEYVVDVMRLARNEGLRNAWVTNGYLTEEAFAMIAPYLDAINIDLKGISDSVYHRYFGGSVRPVLDTIERASETDIWVEVTTLIIPGVNDALDEIRWMAEAIVGISPHIPWHVSRFFPAYRLVDRPPTPIETLETSARIARDAGLLYVYLGNVPGEGEDTCCAACGERLISRSGYRIRENRLQEGACPTCGARIDGVWFSSGL